MSSSKRVIPDSIKAPASSAKASKAKSPKPEPIAVPASPASPSASPASSSASSPKTPKQTLELTIASAVIAYITENHKDTLDIASLASVIKPLLPKRVVKEKGPKDPFAPSPARTALAHYGAEIRATPEFTALKLGLAGTKHIADQWKALAPSERAKYEAIAKADDERYTAEFDKYKESKTAKLFAEYNAKRRANLALLGFAEGTKLPKLPKDKNAPAPIDSRKALYLAKYSDDPEYVDQADNTWIDGMKEKVEECWAKKTKEEKEELTNKALAKDTKRFYAEYIDYTPSKAYIALVKSSLVANPPKKPATAFNKFVKDYVARYPFKGDAKDKKAVSAWKAKYTAQAKGKWKELTAKDASDDAKAELKRLKDAHAEAVGEWEEACAKFAETHPEWVNPVKPKAVKKGKGSPKVAKKVEPVEDEDDEDDAEEVEDEDEEDDEDESESEEDDE